MNNSNDVKSTTNELKVLVIALTIFLGLTGLIDVGFGLGLQFSPELFAEEFNVDYVSELKGLISVFGISILIWGSLTLLSAKWVWEKKIEGTILGIFSGLKLFFASIATFIYTGSVSNIIFDGARGVIIIILAVVLYKKIDLKKGD